MDHGRQARLNRLRWHCRRALLELDLVFQRFWARCGDDLDAGTEQALTRLLDLEDHDLWALVSGKDHSEDPELERLLVQLRTT